MTEREQLRDIILKSAMNLGKIINLGEFSAESKHIDLAELFEEDVFDESTEGWSVTELLTVVQGVTWGGEGCESVFLIDEKNSVEGDLAHPVIGGEDIEKWNIKWLGKYLLFPYNIAGEKWQGAFFNPKLGVDALDFDASLDVDENTMKADLRRLLEHRIAHGYIKYPKAASYLLQHYDLLAKRIFEEKTMKEYNKEWYEYHRPRDPDLLMKPRIVSPRLIKTPRFALDLKGFMPRDSVVILVPSKKFGELIDQLRQLGKYEQIDGLIYILAFLNSTRFEQLLAKKRSKKRGGYTLIDEKLLSRFVIPTPPDKKSVVDLIGNVKKCIEGKQADIVVDKFYASKVVAKGIEYYS